MSTISRMSSLRVSQLDVLASAVEAERQIPAYVSEEAAASEGAEAEPTAELEARDMFPTEARFSSESKLTNDSRLSIDSTMSLAKEIELRLSLKGGRRSQKERLDASVTFSAETAEENVVSQVLMSFVPHEEAEELDEDWQLEAEPCSENIDRWAPMCVPKVPVAEPPRRVPGGVVRNKFTPQSKPSTLESTLNISKQISVQNHNPRNVTKRVPNGGRLRNARISISSTDMMMPDDLEEDRLRAWKHAKDLLRKQEALEAKDKAEREEAERVALTQYYIEEASKGPCTWDSDGNVIWVNPPDLEELPELQASSGFNIPDNDTERRAMVAAATKSKRTAATAARGSAATSKRGGSMQRRPTVAGSAWRQTCRKDPTVFTDGFQRPECFQPPLTETMEMRSGVTLHCGGQEKSGPAALGSGSGMRWAEYRVPPKPAGRAASAPASRRPAPSSPSAPAPEASALLATVAGRPVMASRPASAARPRKEAPGSPLGPRSSDTQRRSSLRAGPPEVVESPSSPDRAGGALRQAPKAPPKALRSKSAEASLGRVPRAPRCRAAHSGSPNCGGRAQPQPPLGATMGHGLHCPGDLKEQFFFPTASNQQRGKASRPASPSTSSPKASKPSEGRLRPALSAPQIP